MRCDQGYLCRVCGLAVDNITESELYLRYVVGEVSLDTLDRARDCHLECNPALSQFIDDPRICGDLVVPADLQKSTLDPSFVATRTAQLTRGYQRLWEIRSERHKYRSVADYPL